MKLTRRSALLNVTAAIASPLLVSRVHAQFLPQRPVKVLVPYLPGGVVDVMARQLAQDLGRLWKQPVVVENRPGASGTIAAEALARSAGDGLTFMIADDGALVSAPLLKAKLMYDPVTDIVPIGSVGASPSMILGPPNSPSLKQLLEKARANPYSVEYASNGYGGPHHLVWERWQEAVGVKLLQVPYNGTAPALQDLAAGRVALMAATPSSTLALVQGGRLLPLAAATSARLSFMPSLPTTTELGYPSMQGDAWYVMMAPGTMLPNVKDQIGADLRDILGTLSYKLFLDDRYNTSLILSPTETAERMTKQRVTAKALFKRLGIEQT